MTDETEALREALDKLRAMDDPFWWREEVDVNGEYTTHRARGYYEVISDIREVISLVEVAEARVAELETQRDNFYKQLCTALVAFYKVDAPACAKLCDELLDRRGGLLGKVREMVRND